MRIKTRTGRKLASVAKKWAGASGEFSDSRGRKLLRYSGEMVHVDEELDLDDEESSKHGASVIGFYNRCLGFSKSSPNVPPHGYLKLTRLKDPKKWRQTHTLFDGQKYKSSFDKFVTWNLISFG